MAVWHLFIFCSIPLSTSIIHTLKSGLSFQQGWTNDTLLSPLPTSPCQIPESPRSPLVDQTFLFKLTIAISTQTEWEWILPLLEKEICEAQTFLEFNGTSETVANGGPGGKHFLHIRKKKKTKVFLLYEELQISKDELTQGMSGQRICKTILKNYKKSNKHMLNALDLMTNPWDTNSRVTPFFTYQTVKDWKGLWPSCWQGHEEIRMSWIHMCAHFPEGRLAVLKHV